MDNNCSGACQHQNQKELSRKAVLGGLASILTGMGLATLGASAAQAATKSKVTLASNVPVGSAKVFTVGGRSVLITQPRAGVFRAFKNLCSHQSAQLQNQKISGGNVRCSLHGATFSADNGAKKGGPARTGLSKYTATKTGNHIYVTI